MADHRFKRTDWNFICIIAEHHFFEWHYRLPKVSIRFFAYSPLIQWLNANISYFVPEDLYHKLSKQDASITTYNHAMAIVIGGALKRIDKENSFYDYSIVNKLKQKIPNYEERKVLLLKNLQELVKQSVDDYKAGKITFRY